MGAWGAKSFENDSALDWVGDFEEDVSIETLKDTFMDVLENDDYVEVDEASAVIAAAEVVAAIKGNPSTDFPDDLMETIQSMELNEDIVKLAIKTVMKVRHGSELQELWDEGGDDNEWKVVVDDLLERLK